MDVMVSAYGGKSQGAGSTGGEMIVVGTVGRLINSKES